MLIVTYLLGMTVADTRGILWLLIKRSLPDGPTRKQMLTTMSLGSPASQWVCPYPFLSREYSNVTRD